MVTCVDVPLGVLASKRAVGYTTTKALVCIHKEFASALKIASGALFEAKRKSTNILQSSDVSFEESKTLMTSWNCLLDLITTTSDLFGQSARSIEAEAVQPLVAILGAGAVGTSTSPANDRSGGGDDGNDRTTQRATKALRRAKERKELALEELTAATMAKSQLIERFGGDLRPALLARSTERIDRAKEMMVRAEGDIAGALAKGGDITTETRHPKSIPEVDQSISPGDFETSELIRLNITRAALATTARAVYNLGFKIGQGAVKFARSIDNFQPPVELAHWVSAKIGVPYTSRIAVPKFPTVLSKGEMDQLAVGRELSPSSDEIKQMANLRAEIRDLKDDKKELVDQLLAAKLERKRSRKGKSTKVSSDTETTRKRPTGEVAGSIVGQVEEGAGGELPSVPERQPDRPREVSQSEEEIEREEFIRRAKATPPEDEGAGDMSSEVDESDEDRSGMRVPADKTADYSDMIPPLNELLKMPFDGSTYERFIEVQRRFEEFLLCLRNLDLSSMVRQGSWVDEDYHHGIEIEEGFPTYPVKAPGGTSFDRSRLLAPMALEWGAKRIDDHQWGLIAYESMLLCYHYLAARAAELETINAPRRDINQIDPVAYSTMSTGGFMNFSKPDMHPGRRQSITVNVKDPRRDSLSGTSNVGGGDNMHPLHTTHIKSLMAASNLSILRQMLSIARVQLTISGLVNTSITQLMIPNGVELCNMGAVADFHPLDVRFRVMRLLDCWANFDTPTDNGQLSSNRMVKDWVLRQLHMTHCAITFKVARLLKFLPQFRGLYTWLNEWSDKGPWYRKLAGKLPTFSTEDDRQFGEKTSKLLKLAEFGLAIVLGLVRALDQSFWGIDIDNENVFDILSGQKRKPDAYDLLRNRQSIIKLIRVMTAMQSLDAAIRKQISNSEKGVGGGAFFGITSPRRKPPSRPRLRSADLDRKASIAQENVSNLLLIKANTVAKNELQSLLFETPAPQKSLDPFWAYEPPIVALIATHLWRVVTDPATSNKLHVDAQILSHGALIVTHIIQHGMDITMSHQRPVSISVLSLETAAVFLCRALWWAANHSVSAGLDEIDLNEPRAQTRPACLTRETVVSMSGIASNFPKFIAQLPGGEDVDDRSPTSKHDDPLGRASSTAMTAETVAVWEARADRIVDHTPQDVWDSLTRPRGDFRMGMGGDSLPSADEDLLIFTDETDPDFFVLDTVLSAESIAGTFYEEFEEIREQAEGVSLLLPSRVERVITEVMMRRLMTQDFRTEMLQALSDYRMRVEPDALPTLIKTFQKIRSLMFVHTPSLSPVLPDFADFTTIQHLPSCLSGPSADFDLYRHFINTSMLRVWGRLVNKSLATITDASTVDPLGDPSSSNSQRSEIILAFGTALQNVIKELRGELIYIPRCWNEVLPGNQHALIVIYTTRLRISSALKILISSPFWPDDDVPTHGELVLSGIAFFDRLTREVALATGLHNVLDKPELLPDFQLSVTSALMRRFKSVDDLLTRCMRTETWQPIMPPTQLHSVTSVDFVTFVHHIFDAACEMYVPATWMYPSFCQFINHLSTEFAEFVSSRCVDSHLFQLRDYAELTFMHLQQPLSRVDLQAMNEFDQSKKRRGKAGGAGALLGAFGLGRKKKDDGGETDAGEETDGSGDATRRHRVASGTAAAGPTSQGLAMQQKDKKSKKKTKQDFEITPEMEPLAARVSHQLTTYLWDAFHAFQNVPLPTMLVRLHNLTYFCEQLPVLAMKFLTIMASQGEARDPSCDEIQNSLAAAVGRKMGAKPGGDRKKPPVQTNEVDAEGQQIKKYVQDVIVQCRQHVLMQGQLNVVTFVSLRVVYVDLGPDIFEDLYTAEFTGPTLTTVVMGLKQTVQRFIDQTPSVFRQQMLSQIVVDLSKAWCLLLAELAYEGHIFDESQLNILDDDQEYIKEFASRSNVNPEVLVVPVSEQSKSFLSRIRGGDNANDIQKVPINLFDRLHDFVVVLATSPMLYPQAGGKCEAALDRRKLEDKRKAKLAAEAAENEQGATAHQMFGQAFADSDLDAMAGRSRSKKKSGGMGFGLLKSLAGKKKS